MIQKAIENDDLDKVLRKLKLLDEANLIPDYDKVRKVYAYMQHDRGTSCDAADADRCAHLDAGIN